MNTQKKVLLVCLGLVLSLLLAACGQTNDPDLVEANPTLETQGLNFMVNSTLDKHDKNPGDGLCAAGFGNQCTLRAAIEETNALPGSDTISVPSGTYLLSKGNLRISDNLVITGGLKNATIIDAQKHEAVFTLSNRFPTKRFKVELHRLTIRNAGYTGIMNLGAQLLIKQSVIAQNNPNTPANSAGILNAEGGTLELNESMVNANGNSNTSRGGGLVNRANSTALIIRSTFSYNIAQKGGGIHNQGILTVIDSTISNNRGQGGSGGVHNDGYASFKNATIAFNKGNMQQLGSDAPAGGLGTSKGQVWLGNTIIANNESAYSAAQDCAGSIGSHGYNLIQDPSDCFIDVSNNLFGLDPLLLPLGFNGGSTSTHAILAASPARNAGNPALPNGVATACEPSDQRDKTRGSFSTKRCDMGAFEFNASPDPITNP